MGSTLLEALQHSRVPVLAVPPGWFFKRVRSITFATDLLRIPQRSKLNTLHELVKAFGATLRILHFYTSKDTWTERREAAPALEKLDSCFYDLDFDVYFLSQPDLISSLSHFISEYKTDLLVVRTQKHHFFERLFTRSMAERAVSYLSVPLLLLPDRS